jgi:hypothetical protein
MPATNFPDGIVIGKDGSETAAVDGDRSAAIADLAEDGSETVTTLAVALNAVIAALRKVGILAE